MIANKPNITVYRKENLPERYHIKGHRRTPPIVIVPENGVAIASPWKCSECSVGWVSQFHIDVGGGGCFDLLDWILYFSPEEKRGLRKNLRGGGTYMLPHVINVYTKSSNSNTQICLCLFIFFFMNFLMLTYYMYFTTANKSKKHFNSLTNLESSTLIEHEWF